MVYDGIVGYVSILAGKSNGFMKSLYETLDLKLRFFIVIVILNVEISSLIFTVFLTERIRKHGFDMTFYMKQIF